MSRRQLRQVGGRRLGDGGIYQGVRKAGKGEDRSFVWLGEQRADLMSICSGRRKQQVLLALAQDLLLSSEQSARWRRVQEGAPDVFVSTDLRGMN